MPPLVTLGASFPKFDAFHAHCAMTISFEATSCLDTFNTIKDTVEMWQPEPTAGGIYNVWLATEEETIWATRTTPVKKYVDDILFEFFGDPKDFRAPGCTVKS